MFYFETADDNDMIDPCGYAIYEISDEPDEQGGFVVRTFVYSDGEYTYDVYYYSSRMKDAFTKCVSEYKEKKDIKYGTLNNGKLGEEFWNGEVYLTHGDTDIIRGKSAMGWHDILDFIDSDYYTSRFIKKCIDYFDDEIDLRDDLINGIDDALEEAKKNKKNTYYIERAAKKIGISYENTKSIVIEKEE